MSKPLKYRVEEVIKRDGSHSVESLEPFFPAHTQTQIKSALWALSYAGFIRPLDKSRCGGNYRGGATYCHTGKEIVATSKPRPLLQLVAEAVASHGGATVDEVMQTVSGYERQQVMKALENAKAKGLVDSVRRKSTRGFNRYYPPGECPAQDEEATEVVLDSVDLFKPNLPRRNGPRFASVFHYAQNISANDSSRKAA